MTGDPPSRPRPFFGRFMLFAPAAVLLAGAVGFSAAWLWASGKLATQMDARAGSLRRAGWTATWSARTVSGFPFRLKVVLADLRLTAPGDHAWGLAAPQLEGQAYLVQPFHWVFAAPQGLTVTRPMGGPLMVIGQGLRASVVGGAVAPWRVALAGDTLTFTTPPDAKPFSFTAMQHAEAHLRPTPDGSGDGDVFVEIDSGKAAPDSVLHRLAADAPIAIAASGRLLKLNSARGEGWSRALDAWSQAGGALRIDRLNGVGGASHVEAKNALLGVDASGWLEGSIPLVLRQETESPVAGAAPATPAAAAERAATLGAAAQLPLIFKDGRTRLGPFEVGPAPMIR